MLFLTSWPYGQLKVVDVIKKKHESISDNHYYIRYENGGTDTTTTDFLFDIPEGMSA